MLEELQDIRKSFLEDIELLNTKDNMKMFVEKTLLMFSLNQLDTFIYKYQKVLRNNKST